MHGISVGLTHAATLYYSIGFAVCFANYLLMLLDPQGNNDHGITPMDGVLGCLALISLWPMLLLFWLFYNGPWRG